MAAIPGFLPSTHGLHYVNHWPHVPDLKVPTPFGEIGIGDASNGLCGGMAFAVADLWSAGQTAPPPSTSNPVPDSPAFTFIVSRLMDSFNLPLGVAKYYEWMNLPSHDVWFLPDGTSHRTISEEMSTLRTSIDAGHPCPLGIVTVHSVNPADLGKNHQILAYGYSDAGSTTTVQVYDPNHPDRDDVTITFDHTQPTHTTAFQYSTGDHTVLGFFAVDYTAKDPAPLFLTTA
jgi:hypothetical protein